MSDHPYKCPYCPAGYYTANALGTHRRQCDNRLAAHQETYSKRKAARDDLEEARKRARLDDQEEIALTPEVRCRICLFAAHIVHISLFTRSPRLHQSPLPCRLSHRPALVVA